MPFYYDQHAAAVSFTTTATDKEQFLTAADQANARLVGLGVYHPNGTSGGVMVRFGRYGTVGTVASPLSPKPRNPRSPAAQLTYGVPSPLGSGRVNQLFVGSGYSGLCTWMAWRKEAAPALLPNGGADGNATLEVQAAATLSAEYFSEWAEG